VAGLLDEDCLDSRFALLSPDGAVHPIAPGGPPGGEALWPDENAGTTSHVTIVDADFDALSTTTTVNSSFGAQMETRGWSSTTCRRTSRASIPSRRASRST
jgi:gamma-glutamyltranspeptidase/glutathione hydrolase